jgi:site-specific recombinase XerD
MARTQRIALTGAPDTYTVLGRDHLPIPAAEEYLQFLRDDGASPNTVKAYAAGLAAWWTVLDHAGIDWREVTTALFGQFLSYLRTGDLPGAARIGAPQEWLSPSSTQVRAAAVLAFYRYHADAHGLSGPYQRLFTSRGKRSRSRYVPMLAGVGHRRSVDRPVYTVRSGNRAGTPVLVPAQVSAILDGCSTQGGRDWSGPPSGLRDRLLFAVLAETGMRLGEALSLRHNDFHIGAGGTPWITVAARQDHPRGSRSKTLLPRRIYIGDDLEALYSAYVWHLVDQGADLEVADLDTHFVFVNLTRGQLFAPMRAETVYAKVSSLTRQARGVLPQRWSPHWLRHTHATALLLSGAPPHVVMRRLGHADIQTTLSTYGWVTEDAEMRTLAQWRSYVAGWKGLHHDHTD